MVDLKPKAQKEKVLWLDNVLKSENFGGKNVDKSKNCLKIWCEWLIKKIRVKKLTEILNKKNYPQEL